MSFLLFLYSLIMLIMALLSHSHIEYLNCFQLVAVIKTAALDISLTVLHHLSEDSVCCTPAAEEPLSLIRRV